MHIVKVKICGLTNYADAKAAMDMGADILGFNFYPKSPRYIDIERAAEIIAKLPAFIDTCAVFVNERMSAITRVLRMSHMDWVQLHGDETPDFCDNFRDINVHTIKAVRISCDQDLTNVKSFFTDALLLDTYDRKQYGGTGKQFDWRLLGHVDIDKRIFLAGGITPENAPQAVQTGVYGIDVCSGIESKPGKKDHKKMEALFENIRHLKG